MIISDFVIEELQLCIIVVNTCIYNASASQEETNVPMCGNLNCVLYSFDVIILLSVLVYSQSRARNDVYFSKGSLHNVLKYNKSC